MMRTTGLQLGLTALSALVLAAGCQKEEAAPAAPEPAPAPVAPAPAAPREPIEPLPETASVNMEKVLLGRSLYFDTRLSGDGTLSCASCHSLDHGGAEPKPVSEGIRGQLGPINAPTVLNSSLNFVQFWDGRAATLEEQAAGPVANPLEMGATWEQVIENLEGVPDYVQRFAALYPDGITQANVTNAIAEYERSLLTPSRFDRFLRGDQGALTDAEKAGYALFKETGCTTCHNGVGVGGNSYQKMGLVRDYFAARGTPLTEADNGRFNVTRDEADRHKFKVPLLRNVALTAPYFHDGSRATLPEAVRDMANFQLGKTLDDAQVASIVAFLESLTGELPAHARLPEGG